MPDTMPRREAARVRVARRARLVIRRATGEDVAAVTAMRLALLTEESGHAERLPPDAELRALRLSAAQLANAREAILLAFVGQSIAGMLRCAVVRSSPLAWPSRTAVFSSAYVYPAYRRRGVLKALVRAADGWCRERGVVQVRLHCVIDNSAGEAAWRALGFAPAEILLRRTVPAS